MGLKRTVGNEKRRRSGAAVLLLCLYWMGAAPSGFAQKLITGTVTDASTGQPLPSATLHVEGTFHGTVSNQDGVYELRLSSVPAVLLVRYIGYQTMRVSIEDDARRRYDVRLEPVTLELGEIVVTGEDPAIEIMRQVIERKQRWRQALQTYRAEAYNRFTMSNDTGIVSIMESLTEAFWDHERGRKEVVMSQRRTSNMGFDELLPAAMFVTNLYDDDVELSGYNMIGVTNPDALRHYRFRLEGMRYLDDRLVYDISVEPRNKLKSAFEGRVAVLDEEFALLEVELRPSEAFLFPPPIQTYDVTYSQQYSNFGSAFWLPVDFASDVVLKVSFQHLLTFPAFKIRQSSRMTDYRVNIPLPDTLYEKDRYLTVDSAAVAADTLLNRPGAAVPLTAREVQAYASIDSTMTLAKAYAPTGLLARFVDMDEDNDSGGGSGSGGGLGGQRNVRMGQYFDFTPEFWFNRVDAAHLALRADLSVNRNLTLSGLGGYKTGLREEVYGAGARLEVGRRRRGHLAFDYRNGVDHRHTSEVHGRLLNSARMLLGGRDYFDYYRNERYRVGVGYRFSRIDTEVEARYNHETHADVGTTTSYDLLGGSNLQRPNPSIEEGTLRSVSLSVAVSDDNIPWGIIGQRRFVLKIEHSTPDVLESDFDFTRFDALLEWRQNTLLRRRLLPNTLDLKLLAGTFAGTLPPQRLGSIDGVNLPLTPFGALRTLEDRPYEGEQYLVLLWEHNFRTLFFELLGLQSLAREGLNVIVHGGHGRTWLSDTRREALLGLGPEPLVPFVSDGFHHEIGLSFSGLFSIVRLDFTKRLDAGGFTVGLGAARVF